MSTKRARQHKEDNYVIIPYRKWLKVYNEKGSYYKLLRKYENLGRPLKFRKRNYRRAKLIEMKYREKEAFEAYLRNKLLLEHNLNQNAIIELVGWGK
ncbi:MAG: hypothetical protein SPG57_01205 [Limosilactobacillus mucosae]|nr:hypothetical protein [Limosilactobacillus mucosae]MDY5412477.1 hypothetical protein [Limosilactobacillus mucosae]